MDVVLPTPLTPMNSTTLGTVDRSRAVSPTAISSARMSREGGLDLLLVLELLPPDPRP